MKWVLRIVNVVQVLLMSAFCVWLSIKVESDCGLRMVGRDVGHIACAFYR